MTLKTLLSCIALACTVAACGDKTPQSESAKQVGAAPKQIVDKAAGEVGKAVEQGAERTRQAEEGKN